MPGHPDHHPAVLHDRSTSGRSSTGGPEESPCANGGAASDSASRKTTGTTTTIQRTASSGKSGGRDASQASAQGHYLESSTQGQINLGPPRGGGGIRGDGGARGGTEHVSRRSLDVLPRLRPEAAASVSRLQQRDDSPMGKERGQVLGVPKVPRLQRYATAVGLRTASVWNSLVMGVACIDR